MSALYSQISERILEQITSGQRRVGDRLPPESDFAAELGISRSTLRLAFAQLEASGVLRRRKRAGTVIIADTPQKRFSMATTGIQELLSLGRNTTLSIVQTGVTTARAVDILRSYHSENDSWLAISGARCKDDEKIPFSVNQVYVPARFAGIESLLKESVTSVFQLIERTFNVSVGRVTQTTRALACPAEEAKTMGLAADTPVLRIEAALYCSSGELMEISVATFDPGRFQLHSEVSIG